MVPEVPWWQRAVVYQIYPRSFLDTDGDGIGDLNGITEKLDYLDSLGVDALWLNPIYPSPQRDWGYDIMDHRGIDPQYGTLEDFDRLLAEAHRRDIRIIMDIVPSVTSHLHPWFIDSSSSRRSPKRDWYIWADPPARGRYPNNWMGVFGGRAWTWDRKTGQFYYHNSLPEQPDLNWRNPEVEEAVLSAMAFWFDRGVDGFRIDVINYAFKDEQLRSNPPCIGRRPYEMQRHLYDKDRPESVAVGQKMRALADRYPGRMLVAEAYTDDPTAAARYYGAGDGPHMVFNFSFMYARFSARDFRRRVDRWERDVGDRGWPCYFLSNHDHPRHISRYARGRLTEARARIAAAMLLTLRGTPFLYMGEELGMPSGYIPRRQRMDPVGITYWPFHPGRDCARTPMQWTGGAHAGFSTAEPWLPLHRSYSTTNAAAAAADPHSLLNWYRRLIRLRREHGALQIGDYHPLPSPPGIYAYIRRFSGERILVALNFSARRCAFDLQLQEGGPCKMLLAWPDDVRGLLDSCRIELAPLGVLIAALPAEGQASS